MIEDGAIFYLPSSILCFLPTRLATVMNPVWATIRCCGLTLSPLMCQKRIRPSMVSMQANPPWSRNASTRLFTWMTVGR